jgi:hypothetical protein
MKARRWSAPASVGAAVLHVLYAFMVNILETLD